MAAIPDSLYNLWIVEWNASAGDNHGQINVTLLGNTLRVNLEAFAMLRAPRYLEGWIVIGIFADPDIAHRWSETMRLAQESRKPVYGRDGQRQGDTRLIAPVIEDVIRLAYLESISYDEYLKTDYWQQVRKEVLWRAGYRCQLCNADSPLDVHHRTYETRGEEDAADVITLCRDCHVKFHGKEGSAE